MGKSNKQKFVQKMFNNEMKKKGIKMTYDDLKGYMDGYSDFKKYLMQREQELGTGTVNFNDLKQLKFCAVYDFELNAVDVMMCSERKILGATYTTCAQAIREYVDIIGIDKFKKYIVGV